MLRHMKVKNNSDIVDIQHTIYNSKNSTRRYLHRTRRDWIINAIKRYSFKKSSSRALEVGPGSGVYLPILSDLFDETVAIDIEKKHLDDCQDIADEYLNLSLEADDILNSNFPGSYFDLILCTEVLEHISESRVAISEMRRLLRPGGILILTSPQRYSLIEIFAKFAFLPGIIQIVRAIYKEEIIEMGHINLMTETQIISQIKEQDFQIIEQHKSGLYIPLVAEFMGDNGLMLEKYFESKIYGTALDNILWTQYYVVQASEVA